MVFNGCCQPVEVLRSCVPGEVPLALTVIELSLREEEQLLRRMAPSSHAGLLVELCGCMPSRYAATRLATSWAARRRLQSFGEAREVVQKTCAFGRLVAEIVAERRCA